MVARALDRLEPAGGRHPADLVDPQGERSKAAEHAVDRLRAKFGRDAVVKGLALDDE